MRRISNLTSILLCLLMMALVFAEGANAEDPCPCMAPDSPGECLLHSETGPCECSSLPPPSTEGQSNLEIILDMEPGKTYITSTFENAEHWALMNPSEGGLIPGSGMRFGPNWVTAIGERYQNNPSGSVVALWDTGGPNTGTLYADITFDKPVSSIGFYYSSLFSVTVETFDGEGNLVGIAYGPATGFFDHWVPINIDVDYNIITRARLHGRSRYTGIDDVVTTRIDDSFKVVSLQANPSNIPLDSSEVIVGILSTPDLDATTVDPSTVLLGDPGSDNAVMPVASEISDINLDGFNDVQLTFCVPEMAQALALDKYSIQLLLTGATEDIYETVGNSENTPPGLMSASQRIEKNRQRLIDEGKDIPAIEKLGDVSSDVSLVSVESFEIKGVISVSVPLLP